MIIIGIDPGLTGSFAWLDASGAYLGVDDLPTMLAGKGTGVLKRRLNPAGLTQLVQDRLEDEPCVAYLEQQTGFGPHLGAGTVFSLGRTVGAIEGILAGLLIPVHAVPPAVWKRHFGLPGKDKERARALAIELFPQAPLGRKKDHHKAEALLIALFGYVQLRKDHATATT